MILTSVKSTVDIYNPDKLFSFTPTLKNYAGILTDSNIPESAKHSLIVAIGATVISLLIGLPAAYAIARFSMNLTGMVLLLVRMLPGITYLVPWYIILTKLGLVGSYFSLIVSHLVITMPMVIWIMISFFQNVSTELEESGRVDGLSRTGAFIRIVLPISKPGIATAALLSFIFSWNQFLFSMVLGASQKKTLPVALFDFIGYASIDWGGLMAAAVLMTLPVFIFSLFAQKHIVAGLSAGATKG
ncbi:carbohydrate ABC transporter permease [Jonesiaceae bacterium BS-20]|uniref:Carbohydrate ABC transporter permease n=1 Tax=Jonesiaceae bacterium BS-20 TaxID=3120821 RepID=A0AAU7DT21_9MICO